MKAIKTILIVGGGNVAWHFQRALSALGDIDVKQTSSRKAVLDRAELIIIAVKDDAIEAVAQKIEAKEAIVVHTSGITGIDVLKERFENCGVIYPLQTLKKGIDVSFNALPLCLEANNEVTFSLLETLAKSISSMVYNINSAQRKHLHLAATLANNFTNHIFGITKEVLDAADLPFDILFPLIDNTITEVKTHNPYSIQTGAAKRSDETTIEAHRAMLDDEQRKIYDILTQAIRLKHRE
ncbi:MAG: DUF2520 domain-containing protein [Bacteroidales bacterium]|jgi:predicted short-subunit dehydrogenase-like oxidoreductase (DUF2520 family)|nr:DUF2520 domain-containing protein [Bacteroidales bacterium]